MSAMYLNITENTGTSWLGKSPDFMMLKHGKSPDFIGVKYGKSPDKCCEYKI